MKTMNTVSSVAVAENNTSVKGAKMTNLDKLSDEQVVMVSKLVNEFCEKLGNDYELIAGALEVFATYKKSAKAEYDAKAKERKEAEKELASANAGKLHDMLKTGDVVDYVLKSQKLVIKGVKIEKITDKRFHVELTEETVVEMNGKEVPASQVANLKLGKKYVAFEAIVSVNGMTAEEYLAA